MPPVRASSHCLIVSIARPPSSSHDHFCISFPITLDRYAVEEQSVGRSNELRYCGNVSLDFFQTLQSLTEEPMYGIGAVETTLFFGVKI